MRVSYITMKFPAAAETFACTDIRTLVETGVEIDVHSMRFQPANAAALLTERGLPSLAVEYATPWHIWRVRRRNPGRASGTRGCPSADGP